MGIQASFESLLKSLRLLSTLAVLIVVLNVALVSSFSLTPRADPPRDSTGLTDVVSWDNYTLWVQDQRVFIHSGEFHAFRLPVPDLWSDIFQKLKAAGLNAVSIYNHWGLSNPAPGVLDFDGYRSLQPLFDAAKAAGLWIVFRPGPYINAETTAGGFALWTTSQVAGTLRTNTTQFTDAWTPYIQAIAKSVVENQITNGGPIIAVQIDNEYFQQAGGEYFAQLEQAYREAGVVVPLTYNDPGEGSNFINGTGAVDIYGLDSYPQSFDCSRPTVWNNVTDNYHSYHEKVNGWQPFYIPEFQGGSFDPWAGPGYNACEVLTGPDFQEVFYKNNWAANVKLISYYMMFGGTSWGGIPFPGVYTSYDYGSAIAENRALTPKFDEIKRQSLFLRSSPQFYKTDWLGDTSTGAVTLNNPDVFATHLLNPDTTSGFYITRHVDSTSTKLSNFTIDVITSNGTLILPQTFGSLVLNGRQSKTIVTDYTWGSSKALYSTASVLFAGTIGSHDVIFLYGDADQNSEAVLHFGGAGGTRTSDSRVKFAVNSGYTSISIAPGNRGLITIYESDSQLVLFSDPVTAATFWAPVIPIGKSGDFSAYWQFGSNVTALVGGPYLVRNATISHSTLALVGDLNATVPLTVIAPDGISEVTWNGMNIGVGKSGKSSLLTGQLNYGTKAPSITLPKLDMWKFADNLPEIYTNFSDSDWVSATQTTTNLPAMLYGDGRVLYGCDYGYCDNTILWRGHFTATGSEKSANLSINGGRAFAASVWINGQFINTTFIDPSTEETDQVYTFPNGSVLAGKDNVITIVQDHMGNEESSLAKSPRGIRGFKLNDGNFTTWKVQGTKGGYTNFTDRVRGVLNEGGTYGERQGWHLPGFDTSSWKSRLLSDGPPSKTAGLGFFVTTFELDIPSHLDVPISFVFDNGSNNQPYRALLYVNGWQMGKRVANLGPQTKFPVHQGILNYSGINTVALMVWATNNVAISPSLKLAVDGIYEGGVGAIATNNPGWSHH